MSLPNPQGPGDNEVLAINFSPTLIYRLFYVFLTRPDVTSNILTEVDWLTLLSNQCIRLLLFSTKFNKRWTDMGQLTSPVHNEIYYL